MDAQSKLNLQQKVSQIQHYWFESLHKQSARVSQVRRYDKGKSKYILFKKPIKKNMPEDFRPWQSMLSPSALYNCSLKCRKAMGISTPEVKWVSIKRWVTTTPSGIDLPEGVYYSIKRHEEFDASTDPPKFIKTQYILLMFPYGNVWSQIEKNIPITEDWMFTEHENTLMLEHLMRKDAAYPLDGYFGRVYEYLINNEDQIGIHLKRKKNK
jgi:hypothetical protein